MGTKATMWYDKKIKPYLVFAIASVFAFVVFAYPEKGRGGMPDNIIELWLPRIFAITFLAFSVHFVITKKE